MIERIVPSGVAVATSERDLECEPFSAAEERAVGRAVETRRREFLTARACARGALAELGVPAQAIPAGPRGEPIWPAGVVGSITHCSGYRACAVARRERVRALGIDAEPDEALPAGVLPDISLPAEREQLAKLGREAPGTSWDRLLFCAKESVYKAWYPLAERWLGFEDALIELDPGRRCFSARLLVEGPRLEDGELCGFSGRWLVAGGLLLTAIAFPAAGESGNLVGANPVGEDYERGAS